MNNYLSGKTPTCNAEDQLQHRRLEFDPWVWKIHWRRNGLPTPVFLPGEFQEKRSLVGYMHGVTRLRPNLATKPPSP